MEDITNIQKQGQPDDSNPGDAERWASLIGGGALVLAGLQQRSLRGTLMSLAGGGLVYQGLTNQSIVKQAQDVLKNGQVIRAEKTVTINKPVEELYRYWRDFENFPRFMQHVKSVTVYNDTRSHWITDAPLGGSVEWDADLVTDRPNELISWASAESADIENSGFVRFKPAPTGRGTEVKVVMEFNLLGGKISEAIAKLLGESPEQKIGDDLNRFKQLMETGEIATTAGQPKGG